MKILRLRDSFKKMPDSNWLDQKAINEMIKNGWKYVSKKEYKDFYNPKESPVTKEEKTGEEVVKTKKTKKK